MKGQELTALAAYKRTPALDNSTWYKGILVSQMAGTSDNNGALTALSAKYVAEPSRRLTCTRENMRSSTFCRVS